MLTPVNGYRQNSAISKEMEGDDVGEVILTMKDIDKSFVGVHALKNACLELKKGEVHALMGENGAGKSTLMKILTGIYSKDSGVIMYEGRFLPVL